MRGVTVLGGIGVSVGSGLAEGRAVDVMAGGADVAGVAVGTTWPTTCRQASSQYESLCLVR